jgi:TonB family protein
MKKFLSVYLLIILIFSSLFQVFSQSKTYYTKDNRKTEKDSAFYYRLENYNEGGRVHGQVQEFYMDSTLKMMGSYIDGKREGNFNYYYPSGKLELMESFKNGTPDGKYKYWYPNGKKQVEKILNENGFKILNAWDTTGRQIVSEGTGDYVEYDYEKKVILEKGKMLNLNKIGIWQGWYDNGQLYYKEEYNDGILMKGISYDRDKNQYEYTIFEEQPMPQGGMVNFYQYISKSLVYPKLAKRKGIEGRVFVQFVIDKTGKPTDIKILRGIGAGCDEETIRLISESPLWVPGKQRGRPVKVKMSLPIQFKLN